jgi:hypothetical protein
MRGTTGEVLAPVSRPRVADAVGWSRCVRAEPLHEARVVPQDADPRQGGGGVGGVRAALKM